MRVLKRLKQVCACTLALSTLILGACSSSSEQENSTSMINGSGSTFIAPLMAEWSARYHQLEGVQINYQSTGSGAGIRQIQEGIVDFAASDQPLTSEELAQWDLMQFPVAAGGIVPVVNLASVTSDEITLDGNTLAGIVLGEITRWNDPRIVALNPMLDLPADDIVVVSRSDGSGTTYNFTEYLSKVSAAFRDTVGIGNSVSWPVGIGGRGNAGVAATVQRIPGSIGYVEFAYAQTNNLTWTKLVNQSGYAVGPSLDGFQAASDQADWESHPDYDVLITDQAGSTTWPIAANTFVLLPKNNLSEDRVNAILDFFRWTNQQEGRSLALGLDYVPLPESVYSMILQSWQAIYGPVQAAQTEGDIDEAPVDLAWLNS